MGHSSSPQAVGVSGHKVLIKLDQLICFVQIPAWLQLHSLNSCALQAIRLKLEKKVMHEFETVLYCKNELVDRTLIFTLENRRS